MNKFFALENEDDRNEFLQGNGLTLTVFHNTHSRYHIVDTTENTKKWLAKSPKKVQKFITQMNKGKMAGSCIILTKDDTLNKDIMGVTGFINSSVKSTPIVQSPTIKRCKSKMVNFEEIVSIYG